MKKVQVQRIFYPVGHGAFYVETFHDCKGKFFTFVYDCGSSNKNLIKKCIEDAVNKGDFIKINALFISHFDEDHVNGLEYLQTYMDSNTKVFIPFYYKNLLLLCPTRMQKLIDCILRLLNLIGIKPIFVKSNNNVTDERKSYNIQGDNWEKDGDGTSFIYSGCRLLLKKASPAPIWLYVPFNLHDENKLFQQFDNEVKRRFPHICLDKPDTWTPTDITNLKGVYNDKSIVSFSINENSLITLSKCLFEVQYYNGKWGKPTMPISGKTHSDGSCLYTGDSILKKKALKSTKYTKLYDNLKNEITKHNKIVDLFQIPHHGSSYNYNKQTILDTFFKCHFINCCDKEKTNKNFYINFMNCHKLPGTAVIITEKSRIIKQGMLLEICP